VSGGQRPAAAPGGQRPATVTGGQRPATVTSGQRPAPSTLATRPAAEAFPASARAPSAAQAGAHRLPAPPSADHDGLVDMAREACKPAGKQACSEGASSAAAAACRVSSTVSSMASSTPSLATDVATRKVASRIGTAAAASPLDPRLGTMDRRLGSLLMQHKEVMDAARLKAMLAVQHRESGGRGSRLGAPAAPVPVPVPGVAPSLDADGLLSEATALASHPRVSHARKLATPPYARLPLQLPLQLPLPQTQALASGLDPAMCPIAAPTGTHAGTRQLDVERRQLVFFKSRLLEAYNAGNTPS